MATFYSSFFSSGLLANHPNAHAPSTSSPSTPRQTPSTLPGADHFLPDPDTTPTAIDFSVSSKQAAHDSDLLPSVSLHSQSGSTSSSSTGDHNDDTRPRLRRRKSSLTTSTSPLAAIKSTTASRSARQSLFVARARSGSDASGYSRMSAAGETATQTNSLMGRMRSGSLGGAAMRSARRVSRKPAPPLPAPPPTAPLPAPPSSTTSTLPLPLPLPSITTTQPPVTPPRRPLARRAHTTDNTLSVSGGALLTPADFLSPSLSPSESPSYFPTPLRTPYLTSDEDMYDLTLAGIPSSPGYEPAVERCGGRLAKMQVGQDYPSPIDGEGKMFSWGREDEAMKEN